MVDSQHLIVCFHYFQKTTYGALYMLNISEDNIIWLRDSDRMAPISFEYSILLKLR